MYSILIALSPFCLDRVATIDGVFDFASGCGDWNVTVVSAEVNTWQHALEQQSFSGAILVANAPEYREAFWMNDLRYAARRLPIVLVGDNANNLPTVKTDPVSIAVAATGHFADASMGTLTFATEHAEDSLWQALQSVRRPANLSLERWVVDNSPQRNALQPTNLSHPVRKRFAESTSSALLVSDPTIAIKLQQQATLCDIQVPQQLSILSARDSWQCGLPINSISAIVEPVREMGYQAARLLKRNLHSSPQVTTPILMPIERIQLRQSCSQQIQYPEIVRAVEFIEKHALRGIVVKDVLQSQKWSRVTFERHFREVLDCSPAEMIRNVRLRHAKDMLVETERPISEIAAACGFSTVAKFSAFFRTGEGVSASEYRSMHSKP